MATTTSTTQDLAEVIVEALEDLELRVYAYVADAARVPCLLVMQPSVDYLDTLSGFCSATWTFPCLLAVARNQDRDAQLNLSRYLRDITTALSSYQAPGIADVEPMDARPASVNIAGAELPGYVINVRIRA